MLLSLIYVITVQLKYFWYLSSIMGDDVQPADLVTKPWDVHEYAFESFLFITARSHILTSFCNHSTSNNLCQFCLYKNELCSLPQWPEMTFADNTLRVELKKDRNCFIEFKCLDALREVDCHEPDVKVASSEVWLGSRKDEGLKNVIKPFDWTFTTKYAGTISGFQVSETDDRIDLEKLKVQEQILHYQEVPLFEDELGDNGCSILSVKLRCMPSGFFALLRFYLRIDGVLARINDTRFHWEKGKSFILREYSSREKFVKDMTGEERGNILKPDILWQFLPVVAEQCQKLSFEL